MIISSRPIVDYDKIIILKYKNDFLRKELFIHFVNVKADPRLW